MIQARSATRGFTLIEVLLATTLLVAGMALAFAMVRSALSVSAHGEAVASGNERMRAVESFLRRRLASAMPLPMETAPGNGAITVFHGGETQMRFVADIPGHLGRGGPYVHALEVDEQDGVHQLRIRLTLLHADRMVEEPDTHDAELLADNLKQVRLRYRGIDPATGQMGEWQSRWHVPDRLPRLVSIEITPAQGVAWPPLVVALPTPETSGRWQ